MIWILGIPVEDGISRSCTGLRNAVEVIYFLQPTHKSRLCLGSAASKNATNVLDPSAESGESDVANAARGGPLATYGSLQVVVQFD